MGSCGHRRSAQSVDSTYEKRPHTLNLSEKHFSIVQFFLRRHSGRAIIAFESSAGMVVANYVPVYTWELPIADVPGLRRAKVYNSIFIYLFIYLFLFCTALAKERLLLRVRVS